MGIEEEEDRERRLKGYNKGKIYGRKRRDRVRKAERLERTER